MKYFSKLFLSFLLLSSFGLAFADTTTKTLIDLLRVTPANVTGLIGIDKKIEFDVPDPLLNLKIKVMPKQTMGFGFSEHHLNIKPDKGLILSIYGVDVHIQEIYYDDQTNKFSVKTKTPLPLNIGSKMVSEKIEETLNKTYKAKVVQAFKELKKIRTNKTKNDVDEVVQTIANIFAPPTKDPMPDVYGEFTLNMWPKNNEKFTFGEWKADLKSNDNFAAGVKFSKRGGKLSIHSLELSSNQGIRFWGDTSVPEIVSINVTKVVLSEQGASIDYMIGAEEAVAGFQLLIGSLKAIAQRQGVTSNCNCREFRFTPIREKIETELAAQLAKYVREDRKNLLEIGATPALLNAID